MMTDTDLVREYAAHESDRAFDALVSRHINLVCSAAIRKVGDPHLAEEVTQAVFIILARKARSLGPKTILSGWLYRTALFVASDALKIQQRRQFREQEAYMQSGLEDNQSEAAWQELSPLLDEAMTHLGQKDRDALVLRFFERKSLTDVGNALGISEEAAKKRVNRAVDKLRAFFARRGVAATTAILIGAISVNSVQAAPAGLAAGVATAAASKGAVAGSSTMALVKGTLKLMAWTKTKMAVAAGVLLLAGTTPVIIHQYRAAASAANTSSIHIKGQIRSDPGDNFMGITPETNFVSVDIWEEFGPQAKWRVEKPERVAVMDGQSAIMYLKSMNVAVKLPGATSWAFDTEWLQIIARLGMKTTGGRTVQPSGRAVSRVEKLGKDGRTKTIVTSETKPGLPDGDRQKNRSILTSDTRQVYQFDARTKRLESAQIFLTGETGDVLIFETIEIDYNQRITPATFHLDLPANVSWYKEPEKIQNNEKYAEMTADEAARDFFEACEHEDWSEAAKFSPVPFDERIKQAIGGLKIVTIGSSFDSKAYAGRFVHYEIQFKDGKTQTNDLALRKDNPAHRWIVDGGF